MVPVLGLLLVGCSGGEEPAPLPVPTAASPSPSSFAVEVPLEAREDSRAGAAAFARYFYETIRSSFVSGDTSELSRISETSCEACSAIVKTLNKEFSAGNRYTGGGITDFTAIASPAEAGVVGVAVRFSSRGYEVTKPGLTSPSALPGAKDATLELQVVYRPSGWRVSEIVGAGR